ncbi:MAG: tRNA (adenosine(37)-N6)-threonylcarbamoyltransferase complex ATPase subunit type 1 TsaE [Thermodesulfobacteriota bacterium]|nr:tRNA (adenosine(37)-N6)-threonylcarbamoyltransferase complex ATPase subunit type 1 TsaE [Thermodesulfobacteriota bacterium]
MKGTQIKIRLVDSKATIEFGEILGRYLTAGDVVGLIGDLGAGKTQFTKGLALGLGVSDHYSITSPTYTIINEYPGTIPLYHFDLYRIEGVSGFEDLGYEEYFHGRGVTVIEWADKMTDLLPDERLEVYIHCLEGNIRLLEIKGLGSHYKNIIDKLAYLFQ